MHTDKRFEPHGFVVFCDESREEANGKSIYLGVYNDVVQVAAEFPVILPNFAFIINIFTNLDHMPTTLEVQVALPGESYEQPSVVVETDTIALTPPAPTVTDDEWRDPRRHLVAKLSSSPFRIDRPGRIRVTAVVDGIPIYVGSLAVVKVPPSEL